MKLLVLHLSDLHFNVNTPEPTELEIARLVEAAMSADPEIAAALTICTGDVCDKGCIAGMQKGFLFLWGIHGHLDRYSKEITNLGTFCTPGNHDTIRLSDEVTAACLSKLLAGDELINGGLLEKVLTRQQSFFENRQSAFPANIGTIDCLHLMHRVKIRGYAICLAEINSALLRTGDNDKGQLNVFVPELSEKADLKLAFFHHPLSYLKDAKQKELETRLESWVNLALCGHTHIQDAYSVGRSGPSFTTCVASEYRSAGGSCAHAIVADLQAKKIAIYDILREEDTFRLNTTSRKPVQYFASVDRDRPSPKNEFKSQLLDSSLCARDFRGQSIPILEVFQYPSLKSIKANMREFKRDKAEAKYDYGSKPSIVSEDLHTVNAESLIDVDRLEEVTFIHGQEKSGKSGLLAKLYIEMQRNGLVPLLLSRQSACKRQSVGEDLWQQLYSEQYDRHDKELFAAIRKEKRVLLVDDFLAVDASRKVPHEFINHALESFPRIIVTVGDIEGLRATLGRHAASISASVDHLQILPVSAGDVRRFVQNISTGLNGDELYAKEDVVRVVSEVLGDQLILPYAPAVARIVFDVLSGMSTEILKGSLGSYYEHLVLEGISIAFRKHPQATVSPEMLKTFLGEVSARVGEENNYIVTDSAIDQIISYLKSELKPVDKDVVIKQAVSANLIRRATKVEMDSAFENQEEVGYTFVQRFHRHYFAGYRLKGQLGSFRSRSEAEARLNYCISSMHLRESAEVVLFTMYQSGDEWLVNRLLEEGWKLLGTGGRCPLALSPSKSGMTSSIPVLGEHTGSELSEDVTVEPTYSGLAQHEQSTEKTNTYDVRLEDAIRLMSNACHFQFVFGQILKNYSSKLSREQLLAMGHAVPALSSKLIEEFLDLIREDREEVDQLANHYLKVQLRHGRRELLQNFSNAPELVFRERLFVLVAFGALRRGVNAMASHELRLLHRELFDRIEKLEGNEQSFVSRLVLMGAMLETGNFKSDEVKALLTKRELSPTGKQVGNLMIRYHLQYFATSQSQHAKLLSMIGMERGFPASLPHPRKVNPKKSIIRRDEL